MTRRVGGNPCATMAPTPIAGPALVRGSARSLCWGIALGALSACNHTGAGFPNWPLFASSGKASGSASVVFVDRANPEGPRSVGKIKITKSMTGYVKPQPIEPLTLPAYPAMALAARFGAARFAVRIDIARDGHVTAVSRSMTEFSTPTKFDADFDQAIEAAVLTWEFNPGWTVPMEPGPDGSPVLGEPEAAESSLDAIITFTSAGTVAASVRD